MVQCSCCTPAVQTGIGLAQMGVCLLFTIISYAFPNWADFSVSSTDVRFGLWEYCVDDNCVSLPDSLLTSKVKVARAFGILGMMNAVSTMVLAVTYLVKKQNRHLLIAASLSLVTFLLVIIELAVGVEEVKDTTKDYGFCFPLMINAIIQAFFAGVSFLSAYGRDRCPQTA